MKIAAPIEIVCPIELKSFVTYIIDFKVHLLDVLPKYPSFLLYSSSLKIPDGLSLNLSSA
jgi:hypothetical protein